MELRNHLREDWQKDFILLLMFCSRSERTKVRNFVDDFETRTFSEHENKHVLTETEFKTFCRSSAPPKEKRPSGELKSFV